MDFYCLLHNDELYSGVYTITFFNFMISFKREQLHFMIVTVGNIHLFMSVLVLEGLWILKGIYNTKSVVPKENNEDIIMWSALHSARLKGMNVFSHASLLQSVDDVTKRYV